jgi:hypothetical protein
MESTCAIALNSSNEFCISRMVSKIGLLRVGATPDVRAAKVRAKELTESWPASYAVSIETLGESL